MLRGEVWWAELGRPQGSGPGYRRPVLIIQSDTFNQSRIGTLVVATITSNVELADAPGNVRLSKKSTNLPRQSVVNVSQLVTVDRRFLLERIGQLTAAHLEAVDDGLRTVLSL